MPGHAWVHGNLRITYLRLQAVPGAPEAECFLGGRRHPEQSHKWRQLSPASPRGCTASSRGDCARGEGNSQASQALLDTGFGRISFLGDTERHCGLLISRGVYEGRASGISRAFVRVLSVSLVVNPCGYFPSLLEYSAAGRIPPPSHF